MRRRKLHGHVGVLSDAGHRTFRSAPTVVVSTRPGSRSLKNRVTGRRKGESQNTPPKHERQKKKMTYQSQTEQPTNLGRLTSNQVFLPLKSLGDPGSSNKPSELPRRSRQKAVAWDPNEQTALACRSSGTSLSSQHGLRGRVRVSRTVSVWTPGENAGAPVPKGSEAPKTPGGPKLQTPDCAPSSDGTCGYPESTDSEAFRPRPCGMRLTWWHDDRLKNSGFHTK